MKAINRAVLKCDPATQAELARRLDLDAQQVWLWVRRGWASPKHAVRIEKVTGVPCEDLIADAGNDIRKKKGVKTKRAK